MSIRPMGLISGLPHSTAELQDGQPSYFRRGQYPPELYCDKHSSSYTQGSYHGLATTNTTQLPGDLFTSGRPVKVVRQSFSYPCLILEYTCSS